MADTGATSGGTFANNASAGTVAWSSPGNAAASDNSRATAALPSAGTRTQYLLITNFGFSIPTGATIDGFLITVEGSVLATTGFPIAYGRIVKQGVIGATEIVASSVFTSTTDQTRTIGSSSSLFGDTYTAADVNASNSGITIQCREQFDFSTVRIDHVQLTVYYTEAAAGQPSSRRMGGVAFAHGGYDPRNKFDMRRWRHQQSGLILPDPSLHLN